MIYAKVYFFVRKVTNDNCQLSIKKYLCISKLRTMQGIIELENMEFHSYHGCFSEEKIIGNRFIVNLKVTTDVSKPSESDMITHALNYQILYNLVKEEMSQPSDLLEHVCRRILDAVYREFANEVINATVTVSKCNPPLGGKLDKVSLTISR